MSDELDSLFGDSELLSEDNKFDPSGYSFQLKSRGASAFREKYRPQTFEEIAPTCSIEQLRNQVDNPGASKIFLMEGRSGTGKTTCAKILAKALVCMDDNSFNKPCLECKNCKRLEKSCIDLLEMNTADKNKVDDMRNLVVDMHTMPAVLGRKIYILDEVQRLTKDAQQVLLTALEDPYAHLLVIMCTTDVSKINKALVDRSCRITFSDLKPKNALEIIEQVFKNEGITAEDSIKENLFYRSQGSVRALLNNIQAYAEKGFDPDIEELDEAPAEVLALFKHITSGKWDALATLLKKPNVRHDCEKLRSGLENYFRVVILNKNMSEAIQYGNALVKLTGSLLEGETTATSMYNNFVIKCLRACAVFKS